MGLLKAVLWDMDGTLIDSEPIWHEAERQLAVSHGGEWDEELAWENAGKPLTVVAARMIERGTKMPIEEIEDSLITTVFEEEMRCMPWTPGVLDVLHSLIVAGIPSVLVTASPRVMAENLVKQAPQGAFVGFVSGSDDLPKKPDPAPYLAAGKLLGIAPEDMAHCVAVEDSPAGLAAAAGSGATTLAQIGFNNSDVSQGPQFAVINGYDGVDAAALETYVAQRLTARR